MPARAPRSRGDGAPRSGGRPADRRLLLEVRHIGDRRLLEHLRVRLLAVLLAQVDQLGRAHARVAGQIRERAELRGELVGAELLQRLGLTLRGHVAARLEVDDHESSVGAQVETVHDAGQGHRLAHRRHLHGERHLDSQHLPSLARLDPARKALQRLVGLRALGCRQPDGVERDLVPDPFQVGAELGRADPLGYRMLREDVNDRPEPRSGRPLPVRPCPALKEPLTWTAEQRAQLAARQGHRLPVAPDQASRGAFGEAPPAGWVGGGYDVSPDLVDLVGECREVLGRSSSDRRVLGRICHSSAELTDQSHKGERATGTARHGPYGNAQLIEEPRRLVALAIGPCDCRHDEPAGGARAGHVEQPTLGREPHAGGRRLDETVAAEQVGLEHGVAAPRIGPDPLLDTSHDDERPFEAFGAVSGEDTYASASGGRFAGGVGGDLLRRDLGEEPRHATAARQLVGPLSEVEQRADGVEIPVGTSGRVSTGR